MNRYRLATLALLVVAVGLVALTIKPSKKETPSDASLPAGAESKRESVSRVDKPAAAKQTGREAARPRKQAIAVEGTSKQPEAAEMQTATTAKGDAPHMESQTPRERAVANWESTVDRVIAETSVPAADQAKRVKETFDSLDKQDQMDGIRRSLNLFQDEQFPALYEILFDKTENPEILDAIFSDALNRPEELKNPLMKELVKDKEHPCFFESARILDVIGELTVKPAPTASP